MKGLTSLSWLFLLLFSVEGVAQSCFTKSIAATTPTKRFVLNADGTVFDTVTGLMWQACSYGEQFHVGLVQCTGVAASVTWQQALANAKSNRFANYDDWRVPNIKELASIVEHQCVEPALNTVIFLSSVNQNYWTSTTSPSNPDHAWVYQFADGKNNITEKSASLYLRLVRFEK